MTNQEAIEILKIERDHMTPTLFTERIEAMDMAISALQEKDLQSTCNQLATDAISRTAAIDVVRKCRVIEVTPAYILIDKAEAVSKLVMLPRVQPEQSDTSEFWRKRADYYSDMCMDLIGEMGKGVKIESVKISENGIEFIKEQPSAQPEIVRCKDCEYGEQDEVGRWFCRSLGCQIGNEDGSGYCADAERRTDDSISD